MRRWTYVSPMVLMALLWMGFALGGWWTWAFPLVAYGVLPLGDQLLRGSTYNYTAAEEAAAVDDPFYDRVLYAFVVGQVLSLGAYLWLMAHGDFATWEVAGLTVSMGLGGGGIGINVAHELGHRRDKTQQRMAQVALLTTLYLHFFIEHNRGHHVRVATIDDPASARRNETLYGFWLRSSVGSWRSAWELERVRLERRDLPSWSLDNQMLNFQLVQLALVLLVAASLGPLVAGAWVVVGGIGGLVLETINYVEHYGLQRQRKADGRWERVLPIHSWNTNRAFGRVLLFELTRHADHHANASRKYQVLRHFEDAPELPAGYTGMMLLAAVPPLFFRVVHPLLDGLDARQAEAAALG